MKKFTQRVLMVCAAQVAIVGAVSVAGVSGAATADPGTCLSNIGACGSPQITGGPHLRAPVACQPTGPKAGGACRQTKEHNA